MSPYPTLDLIVRRGEAIANAIAALPLLGAVAVYLLVWPHWLALAGGLVCTLVLALIMRSYVELVRVIADMLLPK